jgi:8-oxo-dGTP pyrophosphatase MutT (NUDIX family)
MRHTVRAIILKDKHVLLVTGHGAGFYWTPGGKVENGESIIQTLHREIKEELGVTIKEYSHYYSFKYRNQEVDNFLVTINEEIKVSNEITGYVWYANDSAITPSNRFIDMLKPKLTDDNLII